MSNSKKCKRCLLIKNTSEFYTDNYLKDGYGSYCKECESLFSSEYRKTKKGLISGLYGAQKYSSKKRNHNPPEYTLKQLSEWLLNDWLFDLLYNNWVNCGYQREMRPSIDRLDDNKGYSFDNIQIMTWGENKAKGHRDMRSGKLINRANPQKIVIQMSKSGEFIKEFVSAGEAHRQTSIDKKHISACCIGKRKTAYGFMWKFKKQG